MGDGLGAGKEGGGGGLSGAQLPLRARLLQRLCRRMLPPLCNAMLACTRKRLPTAAAFINTIALPQLFSAQVRVGERRRGEGGEAGVYAQATADCCRLHQYHRPAAAV